MKMEPNWTPDEFYAYVMFYVAQADHTIKQEEKDVILKKVDFDQYLKIKKECENDNDYQCLKKIMAYREKHFNTEDASKKLLKEIKDLFLSDGEYDTLEQNMYLYLKQLFRE